MTSFLIGLSRALPGREKDYADWYAGQHLADVRAVPGVVGGILYGRLNAQSPHPWALCGMYELDRSVDEVLAEIGRRAGGAEMPMTDAIDRDATLFLTATALAPRVEVAKPSGATLLTLVLANPAEGQDAAYNAWYSDRHIPDVLAVPGFVAARRFRLAAQTAGKPSPWRYMATYELEAERLPEIRAEMAARSGGPLMPDSPSVQRAGMYTELFQRLS